MEVAERDVPQPCNSSTGFEPGARRGVAEERGERREGERREEGRGEEGRGEGGSHRRRRGRRRDRRMQSRSHRRRRRSSSHRRGNRRRRRPDIVSRQDAAAGCCGILRLSPRSDAATTRHFCDGWGGSCDYHEEAHWQPQARGTSARGGADANGSHRRRQPDTAADTNGSQRGERRDER